LLVWKRSGKIGTAKLLLSRLRREGSAGASPSLSNFFAAGAARAFAARYPCGKGPQEKKKSRALNLGTAPLKRDLQLVLYRISLFVSPIICDQVEPFNTKSALPLPVTAGEQPGYLTSGNL
jgi:hypothetical protein